MAEFRTPQPIGTILPTVAVVGTIATQISQPNLAAASLVGSIGSPITVGGGTVGTIQSGVVSATIIGGNVPDVGTVGTVLSIVQVTLPALVGVVATVSATIRGASGTLYGILASNPTGGTISATIVCLFFVGTASGTVPWQMTVPSNSFQQWNFPWGLRYTGSLIASIMGTVSALFLT